MFPLWLSGSITLITFNAVALLGLAGARKAGYALEFYQRVDNETIGWIFSAILVIYAIAIGLIAIATWENSVSAATAASHEASQIPVIYRSIPGLPEPVRDDIKRVLVKYTVSIIYEGWPAQACGEVTEAGIELLAELGRLISTFEPANSGQAVVQGALLRAFANLVEHRRLRVEASAYAVPGSLWVVVLLGATLSISSSYVFNIHSFAVHALMTALLTSMIALLVFFIAATDHPYRGSNAIKPVAYEIVLHDLALYG